MGGRDGCTSTRMCLTLLNCTMVNVVNFTWQVCCHNLKLHWGLNFYLTTASVHMSKCIVLSGHSGPPSHPHWSPSQRPSSLYPTSSLLCWAGWSTRKGCWAWGGGEESLNFSSWETGEGQDMSTRIDGRHGGVSLAAGQWGSLVLAPSYASSTKGLCTDPLGVRFVFAKDVRMRKQRLPCTRTTQPLPDCFFPPCFEPAVKASLKVSTFREIESEHLCRTGSQSEIESVQLPSPIVDQPRTTAVYTRGLTVFT